MRKVVFVLMVVLFAAAGASLAVSFIVPAMRADPASNPGQGAAAGLPSQQLIGESIVGFPTKGLINEEGESVSFESLPDKPVLLSFIYTRCPMSNMCPLITRKMRTVQEKMQAVQQGVGGKRAVRFVLVTFDPEYDRPEVLRDYAGEHDIDLSNFDFWTGPPATIEKLTDRFHVNASRTGSGPLIAHNMRTYILDGGGVVRGVYTGSGWNVQRVVDRLRKMT